MNVIFRKFSFILGLMVGGLFIAAFNWLIEKSLPPTSSDLNNPHVTQNVPQIRLHNAFEHVRIKESPIGDNEQAQHLSAHSAMQISDATLYVEHNWQKLLTESLSDAELMAFSEVTSLKVVEQISNNEMLFTRVLNKIMQFDKSEQRAFLLKMVTLMGDAKLNESAQILLASERDVDKASGILVLMQVQDLALKTSHIIDLLQTSPSPFVINELLHHLKASGDANLLAACMQGIESIALYGASYENQMLALRTLLVVEPVDPDFVDRAITSLLSDQGQGSQLALDLLQHSATNLQYYFSRGQKEQLITQLQWLADDTYGDIDKRVAALIALKSLTES
ncbi:hypothetical protein [Thalassotalea sp. PLHSN55]|uniref:hypothetical protein n=1 Tax=Thalassotalea sp. PLHSN55 TaxID=3435888 RepID=UPI003F87C135